MPVQKQQKEIEAYKSQKAKDFEKFEAKVLPLFV